MLEPANRIILRNTGHRGLPRRRRSTRSASGSRPAADRPLIREAGDLERLLAEREPLYREFAAHVVDGERRAGRGRRRDRGGAPLERVTVPIPGRSYDVVVGSGVLVDRRRGTCRRSRCATRVRGGGPRRWPTAVRARSRRRSRGAGIKTVSLSVPVGRGREDAAGLRDAAPPAREAGGAPRRPRSSPLGGGTVGDLAGFVAATYMRGIPFVQVPTTLTAQVDAAIGGKTAVNLPEGKNLVGAFHQPLARAGRRRHAGDAGPIATSAPGWRRSRSTPSRSTSSCSRSSSATPPRSSPATRRRSSALVARCVAAKARTVAEDERDRGARLVLNYGHTLGHALERLDAFAGRTHGEAIAIGMVFAARLAEARDLAPPGLPARTNRLLTSLGLETDGRPAAGRAPSCRRSGWTRSSTAGFASSCSRTSDVPSWSTTCPTTEVRDDPARDGSAGVNVLFLFGPNLGALGRRDPAMYGDADAGADHGRGRRARHARWATRCGGIRPITRASWSGWLLAAAGDGRRRRRAERRRAHPLPPTPCATRSRRAGCRSWRSTCRTSTAREEFRRTSVLAERLPRLDRRPRGRWLSSGAGGDAVDHRTEATGARRTAGDARRRCGARHASCSTSAT